MRFVVGVLELMIVLNIANAAELPKETDEKTSVTRLPFSIALDADQTVHLAWNFHKDSITLQLTYPSTGWIGIGFSQTASMFGADLILMGKTSEELYAVDAHADQNGVPEVDEMQNVQIISGFENGTHTIMTIVRNLVTCDEEDMDLKEGTYRVIWAYGDKDTKRNLPSAEDYHGGNRGAKSLKLLNPLEFAKDETDQNERKYFDIRPDNFRVPPVDTYYLCKAFEIPNATEKRHVTGYSVYLTPGNEKIVHHIVVYMCEGELSPEILGKDLTCYADLNPWDVGCVKLLAGWAVGMDELRFPDHVGFPIGGPNSQKYVILQTHYDNTEMKEHVDSSGIRFFYTNEPRVQDAGLMSIASNLNMIWAPPGRERYEVDGHCVEACLSMGMEKSEINEVNVLSVVMHGHMATRGMTLHHYRDGKEMRPIAEDKFYDFNYQNIQYIEDGRVKLRKGDSMKVNCEYDTLERSKILTGGLPTTNEMCSGFIFYYPALKMDYCDSQPGLLVDPTGLPGLFSGLNISVSSEELGKLLQEVQADQFRTMQILSPVFDQVEWTEEKRNFAETYMNNLSIMPFCLAPDGYMMDFMKLIPAPKYKDYHPANECENRGDEDSEDSSRLTPILAVPVILFVLAAAKLSLNKS